MDSSKPEEVYDLLILVDATYSMFSYLESLQSSLPKIISISQLTSCFSRIGLIAYRDYTEADRAEHGLIEWSGWFDHTKPEAGISSDALIQMTRQLEPIGGGDYPEATKTGLAKAYDEMRSDATTMILLYTDAPPHMAVDGNLGDRNSNQERERNHLGSPNPYTADSRHFIDWVSAAKMLRNGKKKAHVFSFLDAGLADFKALSGYYSYLSAITHGACLYLTKSDSASISQTTVDVLLAWMGTEKLGSASIELPAEIARYINGKSILKLKDESDLAANTYFWGSGLKNRQEVEKAITANIAQVKATSDVLKIHLPKKKTLVTNFAERYNKDHEYKIFATGHIAKLIETDVTAISLNPVFGSLWRAVCNDRENPERESLLNSFSLQIEKIADADEKARMKAWLENSYDYTAEIKKAIEDVPESQRFPCVFLDPTLDHTRSDEDDDGNEEGKKSIAEFRRDELLEIGRSCDYRILCRLGKVLTRLTYVNSPEDLPDHIASAGNVEMIPMTLASREHGYKFWRILLHIVVPGTMLSTRPSVVLSALALKMGMAPLFQPACVAMMYWRDKWNDLSVPETWNTNCLSLLIDADNAYRSIEKSRDPADGLLKQDDKYLFEKLVSYKLTEANLNTTLTAKIGWTPEKTAMPIGPLVICRSCEYPRSVSIMVEKSGGRCGICVANDYADAEAKEEYTTSHVSKDDTEESSAAWVECSIRSCRAQYVVYNAHKLNVRPKCFYCRDRAGGGDIKHPVRWLECTTCLNRMQWPQEFRGKQDSKFQCVACSHGRTTIIEVETSAQELIKENSSDWLLENGNNALKEPFNKRTVFHTISATGTENFARYIRVLPEIDADTELTIKGKLVRNSPALKTQLCSWIDRRCAETVPCSLCFSDFPHNKLRLACGRSGCDQHICSGCLGSWYGINRPGNLINTATLHCPFCRRAPAAKTLAAYGQGIHAVGNLRMAVEEQGKWIYAWCMTCSKAKQHTERSCAQGSPPIINDFVCEECIEEELERLRREEAEAQRALEAAQYADAEAVVAANERLRAAAKERRLLERPVKECPKCKTPTQKTTGCDHLKCGVCGTDWCWACGKHFSHREIYKHMNRDHGGYYEGGNYDDGDDEEYRDVYWHGPVRARFGNEPLGLTATGHGRVDWR